MDEYIGIIKIFGGNFAPQGWALCNGQLMSIAQNTALFSILGTTYGGDGQTTFALPDLRGRMPIGQGVGPGLSPVQLGQVGGTTNVTLLSSQMPPHTHAAQVTVTPAVNADGANTDSPEGAYMSSASSNIYNSAPAAGQFAGSYSAQATIGVAGGGQPFSVQNPYLGINYIICLEGLYPPRS